MKIIVASRRKKPETLLREFADATLIDVTSRASDPWVRFSPFYPHGGIPVPFTPGEVAASVEGIWQGLKVFETADINAATLTKGQMTRGRPMVHVPWEDAPRGADDVFAIRAGKDTDEFLLDEAKALGFNVLDVE